MWSICKKELRQFFSSLTGYIAIIVFLLVNGLVLFVFKNNILDYGYATLENFFSFAPWVLLFLISAITMRSFSEEFKSGTFEILRTKPLSRWAIVGGKFLGSFIVAFIALLPTLVYYFTINHLAAASRIDAGAATGSYLGLLLLTAVFTAIGVCVSSFTTNAVVAFILSLIASVLFYFGFTAISQLSFFQSGSDYYIEMLGIDFHYRSMSRGVMDTRDIVYFLSLIAFFLLVTRQNLKERNPQKGKSMAWWLVLLAGVVVLNVFASSLHRRYDLTEEKRYSLSRPTKTLLSNLDDNVEVEVYLKGDFPANFRKLAISVSEFLEECKEYGGHRIQLRFVDPFAATRTAAEDFVKDARQRIAQDPAAVVNDKSVFMENRLRREMALDTSIKDKDMVDFYSSRLIDSIRQRYDILPYTLQAPSKVGDEQTVKQVLPGAVIHYKGRSAGVDFLKGAKSFGTEQEQLATLYNNVEATMEYKFASTLQKLSLEKKPVIGYALGHGEGWGYNVDDAVKSIAGTYGFDTVNIRTEPLIPQYDALVILKPTQKFSAEDKFKIDQYVMHGGRLFWMIDNMYTEFDSLTKPEGFIAFDRGLDLEDLLFNYGVRINQTLLQDMQCDVLGQQTPNGQYRKVNWPFFPILDGTDHPISKNLDGVTSMFPTVLDTVGAEGIRKTVLLHSSNNSRLLPAPARIDFEFMQIAPEAKEFRAAHIPVAMLLEGRFRSPYVLRGRPKPVVDSMASYGYEFVGANIADNRMIVVSDGDIATNKVSPSSGPLPMGQNFYTGYQFANKEFFMNSLDYLVNPSDILQTRAKEFTLRLLDPKKVEAERTKWQFVNIALPILLVLFAGFAYQQLRRRQFEK